MKNLFTMKKLFLLLLFVTLVGSGCSKYGYVRLHYPTPPESYLPEEVHSIAAVNRSLTAEEDSDSRIVEAIISTEVAGSDLLASDNCIKGVYDGILAMPETELLIPSMVKLFGTGTRELPELLGWEQVERICKAEGADALLVLETFDSNTDLLASTATNQLNSLLSKGALDPNLPGQIKMNVNCYWRLYHPASRKIIDQYQYNSYTQFNLHEGLIPPHALPETAYNAGRAYIDRFLPSYYTVKRDLYKRTGGSDKHQFMAGYRRAEVANWQEAIEIWHELADHSKAKTAGRACLNIAVANEVLGDTDNALEWAKRSYEIYNDKLGRSYAKILLRRKNIETY